MADKSPHKRQAVLRFDNGKLAGSKRPLVNPQPGDDPARMPLEEVAKEMRKILPGVLLTRPDAQPRSTLYQNGDADKLDSSYCPGIPPTIIKVTNADTIDTALELAANSFSPKRVCILNMANARSAGGGWMHGALAQEEALCYRTSLSATLRYNYYPLPEKGGVYSPRVLVLRESMKDGHGLMDMREPKNLPVLSVISVAAVCQPPTIIDQHSGRQRYAFGADRRLMEEKMRVILRIAAKNGHRQIVLGAFGCGAFGNPKEEVADMWKSVFSEAEFAAGWWQDVVFAVMDSDGRGNFHTFHQRLDGVAV
jgi:uncharacterized protein (TIGR02452 family)